MSRTSARPPNRLEALMTALQHKLQDEPQVLETLVSSLARGQSQPEVWSLLHEAAARDDRVADLAFAYERLLSDRKFKFLPTSTQCEVLMHAGAFFADVFGDKDGALNYLEQVLVLAPSHAEAFRKIESLLAEGQNGLRLADLCASVAAHRPDRGEQLALLWRAAAITDGFPEEHERAIKIYQQLLRMAPDDERVQRTLEARYRQAGKFRDLARLLEQSVSLPSLATAEARAMRERLIDVYMTELGEPERALPHIEEILRDDPAHEMARRTAHKLLSHKALLSKAAAALADAYERLGTYPEAAALLAMQLESMRGTKKAEVQKRLAILKQDRLDDPAGAFTMLEGVVGIDPGDDDARRRYRELAVQLGRQQDAAKLLSRAATGVKDAAVKARVLAEVGQAYLDAGDPKRARASLASVVEMGGDQGAVLAAARALAAMHADASEKKPLADLLELLSRIEPREEDRLSAAERLATLADSDLGDKPRAIAAYRMLLGSPLEAQAVEALEGLYQATGAYEDLIGILDRKAAGTADRGAARGLAERAAQMRTAHTTDRARAIVAWTELIERYGPSREANAQLIPLLEQERQWPALATTLEREADLAPAHEKVPILLRLAQVRLARLHDTAGAIAAYRSVWTLDPKEATTRAVLEKMLGSDEGRLEAATLLEPCYRAEGGGAQLVRVLDARAEASPDAAVRLSALEEAAGIVEGELKDPKRAFELSGRALAVAVASDPSLAPPRLERFERLAQAIGDNVRRAQLLLAAVQGRRVDDPMVSELAKRAGEALVLAGDPGAALAVYRRALEFEPSSADLLGRIDTLLRDQGKPEDRLVLYRAALEQARTKERRRELLHAIGTLQRRELGDPMGAVATWRAARDEAPDDLRARAALLDALEAAGDFASLYEELRACRDAAEGAEKSELALKMGEAAYQQGDFARALAHYLELLGAGHASERLLSATEALAEASGDHGTLELVLERRVANATEPQDLCAWLERLGEVLAERRGEPGRGAEAWKRAAKVAEQMLADDGRALRLYERALLAAQKDREAATELCRLLSRAEAWDRLPTVYEVLVATAPDDARAVAHLVELESILDKAGGRGTWLSLVQPLLSRGAGGEELAFCRARVLAGDGGRRDEAAEAFRALLESKPADPKPVVTAFEAFLSSGPERREDRRFLYRFCAREAPDAQRVSALMAWASAEETSFGDPETAVSVYRQVTALEPEHAGALEALVRLLLVLGDNEGVCDALVRLRDHSEGATRREREIAIAELLLGPLARPSEALTHVTALLDASPTDTEALDIAFRALHSEQARNEAAEALEKAALAVDDDGHALEVLRALLATPPAPELIAARRRWFGAMLDRSSGDPEAALGTALRAVSELPDDDALWERAEKLARSLERPQAVADAYRDVLSQTLAPGLASELGRRAVDHQEEWFDDPQAVIGLLRRVLTLSPEAVWARDRLKLAYSGAERWADLFALYDEAIARANDDESRAELLREAGQAAKDFAVDPDRATGYFERLLACRPGDKGVSALLERLYERQKKIEPLIGLLRAELEGLAGEAAQKLRARLAGLQWRSRGDAAAAFALVEEMLADEPGRADAYQLLEEMVFASDGEAEVVAHTSSPPPAADAKKKKKQPTLRERAVAMLKARYNEQGRMADLARVLEVELVGPVQPKDRVARHRELLTLRLETLKDDPGAFTHAAALVELEPRTVGHRTLLLELADRLGWHERFVAVLAATADACADPPLVARLFHESALVCRDKLADVPRAITLLSSVLELAPKDRAFALTVARDLDDLLAASGKLEERCWALERIATLEGEPDGARAALVLLSRIAANDLSDPERAVRAWRAYIDEHAADDEARTGLASVLRGAGRFQELADLLEERGARTGPSDAAKRDAIEVGVIYGRELKMPDKAIDAWMRIRTVYGPGEDNFAPLAELLDAQKRWDDLAALLLDELERATLSLPSDQAAARLGAMRKVAEKVIRNTDRATARRACRALWETSVALWVSPMSDDPGSSPAALWSDAAFWALDQLVRMAIDLGEHAEAVTLLLKGSELVLDPARARSMRRQAAAAIVERLSDVERAVAVYRELLTQNDRDAVADAVLPELARLYSETGFFGELADLWERQAVRQSEAGNGRLAAELWSKSADLCEKRLADVERSIGSYRRSAELGSHTALRELARLFTGRGQHIEAASVLERVCEQAALDTIAQDTIALANAYLAAGDRERARQRLEQGVQIRPPGPVRAKLREVYREEQSWDKLAALLCLEAEDAGERGERLRLLTEVASIHLEQRSDPASAVVYLEQARKLEPEDSAIVLTLAQCLGLLSRHDEASAILRAELERYGSRKPKERALVHFELARVSLMLGERARALAELAVAAKIDPAHPAILHALGRLSFEEGQLDRAQRTLRALLLVLGSATPDAESVVGRAEVLLDLSAIAEMEQEPDRAHEFLESALQAAGESEREARRFERVLEGRARWDLLVRCLEGRLGSSGDAMVRASILEGLAVAYEQHLGLTDERRARLRAEADRTLTELGTAAKVESSAWSSIESVYGCLGDHDRQADLLRERIDRAAREGTPLSDPEPWYRLARARLLHPEARGEGLDLLQQALGIRADPVRAEAMLRGVLDADPNDQRAALLYERVARQDGRDAWIADALHRLFALGIGSADAMREGVALFLKLGQSERAEAALDRAARVGGPLEGAGLTWAESVLADLCEKRGDLSRAADLRERAAASAEPGEKRSLYLQVAAAAKGPLGDLPRAARVLEVLRAHEPADRALWEPLLEVHRRLGDPDALVALISQTLPLIESVAERSLLELERITLMLKNPDREAQATDLLRALLEEDPGQVQAALLLSGLLEKAGRTDELAELLRRQIDHAKDRGDAASVVSLSLKLGGLLEQMPRVDEALDVYHCVLDWDAASNDAVRSIVRLCEARGDTYEIADALEKLLRVEVGEEASRVAMRLFALRNENGDEAGADRAIGLGFRAHPTNGSLREQLVARYRARGAFRELADLLQAGLALEPDNPELLRDLLEACRKANRWEPAALAVTSAIAKTPNDARLYRDRAGIFEGMGRCEEAVEDYERAYAEGGAELLRDLLEGLGRHAERLGAPGDRATKLRLAQILCETGSSESGRNHLVELLKRDPKDRDVLRAMARIEEREEHWDAASTIFRRLLPLEEGDELTSVALKLADACERAGRPADARAGLERALKSAPGHAGARAKLKDVYQSTGANRELAQLVLEDAQKQGDVAGRFALLLRCGGLLLGPDGDSAQAVGVLEEARSLRTDDDDAVVLLGRAYVAVGRTADGLRLFEDTIAGRKAKRGKSLAAMHHEISRIRLLEGDLSAALEALAKAFEMEPHDGEIAFELGLLARDLDDHDLAARAFRSVTFMKTAAAGSTDGATPAAKAQAYYFLALMAQGQGDPRKARLLVQKALSEDPTLVQAKQLLEELKPNG
jgi:golgin subfamily B member 1